MVYLGDNNSNKKEKEGIKREFSMKEELIEFGGRLKIEL